MKDVALFYGTYTGVTGTVAQKIVNELGADKVDLYNICKDGDKMENYKKLIIGTSTWSIGELQKTGMLSCLNYKRWILQVRL